jgi:cell division protein FtsZ
VSGEQSNGKPMKTLESPETQRGLAARIVAVGVGGAGTNAINHMMNVGVGGVEFISMNTDAQALELARSPTRVRLGERLTHGLGAGGDPIIGEQAALESYDRIREQFDGSDMVFITAGMGGGTGTGASPLVAQAARDAGALTVAIVTTPFAFERRRKRIAEGGVEKLREVVDALILVPNERLMELHPSNLGAFEAYRLADDVLRQGIQGISDLITIPGLINLDFADIRMVMSDTGGALMTQSRATGERRAEKAAHDALANPLLDIDISGARGVIFNISGGDDLTMGEVHQIAQAIASAAHPDANIIFGSVYDSALTGTIKLTVVATGFEPRVVHPDLSPMSPAREHQARSSSNQPRAPMSASPASAREAPPWPPTGSERPRVVEPVASRAPQAPASAPRQEARPNGTTARPDSKAPDGRWYRDEDEQRLRRLEELRSRRLKEMSSTQEAEEYVAGETGGDRQLRQPWKRLFGRR